MGTNFEKNGDELHSTERFQTKFLKKRISMSSAPDSAEQRSIEHEENRSFGILRNKTLRTAVFRLFSEVSNEGAMCKYYLFGVVLLCLGLSTNSALASPGKTDGVVVVKPKRGEFDPKMAGVDQIRLFRKVHEFDSATSAAKRNKPERLVSTTKKRALLSSCPSRV